MAKRMIRIDSDTIIGYNYMLSKYYVTNKGTSTYRKTEEKIKEVLDIVAPNNTVTIEDLTNIRIVYDTLEDMSYTWSDDGSYIKTLQLNDYEENPIVLDCEKKKLYIMNTNLIFDLTTTESNRERCLYLQSYFKEQIGLSLTYQQLLDIYNFLISFYKPYIFNYIEDIETTPLTYSNKFAIANYQETKKLKAQYLCTCNPDSEFTYPKLADILSTANNTITTKTPITLPTNTTIKVVGATTTTDSYTLSADGEYTVKEILNNTITTNEDIPYSYTIPYPTCKYISSTTNIQSINRETNTITLEENTLQLTPTTLQLNPTSLILEPTTIVLSSIPTTLKVGDKVTSVTPSTKKIVVGSTTLTLTTDIPTTIEVGDIISVIDTTTKEVVFSKVIPTTITTNSKVTSISSNSITIDTTTFTIPNTIPTTIQVNDLVSMLDTSTNTITFIKNTSLIEENHTVTSISSNSITINTTTLILPNTIPSSIQVGDIVSNITTSTITFLKSTNSIKLRSNVTSISSNSITINTTTLLLPNTIPTNIKVGDEIVNITTNTNITFGRPVPNTLHVGDIIHVNNTQQEVEGETVSCNGTYTISSISSNTITTQETIPTNYTYIEGTTYPTISKQILLGNVDTINNKTLTFTSTLPMQPIENSKVLLTINNTSTLLTVLTTTPTTIRVADSIEDYTTTYPQLQQPTPVTNILVYVDSTDSEDLFPIGEFMVDNFTQCQQYLSTYLSSEYIPTTSTYNLVNKPVPTTYPNPPIEGVSMKLKGVYSKVYTDVGQ